MTVGVVPPQDTKTASLFPICVKGVLDPAWLFSTVRNCMKSKIPAESG